MSIAIIFAGGLLWYQGTYSSMDSCLASKYQSNQVDLIDLNIAKKGIRDILEYGYTNSSTYCVDGFFETAYLTKATGITATGEDFPHNGLNGRDGVLSIPVELSWQKKVRLAILYCIGRAIAFIHGV